MTFTGITGFARWRFVAFLRIPVFLENVAGDPYTLGASEIWVMGPHGEVPRRIIRLKICLVSSVSLGHRRETGWPSNTGISKVRRCGFPWKPLG